MCPDRSVVANHAADTICLGNLTTPERFQGSAFFFVYTLTGVVRWSYEMDNSAIQVINAFLEYETNCKYLKIVSTN